MKQFKIATKLLSGLLFLSQNFKFYEEIIENKPVEYQKSQDWIWIRYLNKHVWSKQKKNMNGAPWINGTTMTSMYSACYVFIKFMSGYKNNFTLDSSICYQKNIYISWMSMVRLRVFLLLCVKPRRPQKKNQNPMNSHRWWCNGRIYNDAEIDEIIYTYLSQCLVFVLFKLK